MNVLMMGFSALMAILNRLAGQAFFEAVLTRIIVFAVDKLAPMTTNTLDDEIVMEIKKRLSAS